MPSERQESIRIDDDIELTGHRLAPSQQAPFRLPPPFKGTKPRTETIILVSSDEEVEPPPAKRRKTTVCPSLSHSEPSSSKRKYSEANPKAKRPLFIDMTILPDGETYEQAIPPPRKRLKKPIPPRNKTKENPILIIDSDEELEAIDHEPESDSDYENHHHGYEIGWSSPVLDREPDPEENIFNVDIDVIENAVARLSLHHINPGVVPSSRMLAPLPPLEAGFASRHASLGYNGASSFISLRKTRRHDTLRASCNLGRARADLPQHRPPQIPSPTRLNLLAQFQMADACHSIAQSSTKILLASSTPGGTTEDEHDRIDPYNSETTLVMWTEDARENWLPAHFATRAGNTKYYDIKSAQFDPVNPDIFVSTGLDGKLVVWRLLPIKSNPRGLRSNSSEDVVQGVRRRYVPVKQWGDETYGANPCHDVVYRPPDPGNTNSLFAAPCDNGTIFLHSYAPAGNSFCVRPLRVPGHAGHKPGATVWGRHATSSALFVCSEGDPDSQVYHSVLNFETGQMMYHLDDHHSGEELALDPEGGRLALCTATDDGIRLRLYDVAHSDRHHTASVILPPASPQLQLDMSPEVRSASWSPDGLLLAVGGNDDCVHVYDVRSLERGPVLSLVHETRSSHGLPMLSLSPEARSEIKNCYGITVLSWTSETCFNSPSLGLVTGGGDHCIALWDVKTACKERQVLAELHGHVGVAHFGDLSKREKPLVAGDTDGHIYIYNFDK